MADGRWLKLLAKGVEAWNVRERRCRQFALCLASSGPLVHIFRRISYDIAGDVGVGNEERETWLITAS